MRTVRRLAVRGLLAVLCFSAVLTSVVAQTSCRGFQSRDEITGLTLSSGVSSESFTEPATVRWEFPSSVCTYRWLIELSPINGGSVRDREKIYIEVNGDAREATISADDVTAGVSYRIRLVMEYAPDRYDGPEAEIEGELLTTCFETGTPGAPSGLTLKEQSWQGYTMAGDSIELCWSPSRTSGFGCPDEYTLALRVQPTNAGDLFEDEHAWRFEKFPVAGCHRIDGVEHGTTYDIGIRAYNAASMRSGNVTLIQGYATDQWRCVEGDFYATGSDHTMYDWCPAAKNGQCSPMTCDEIASAEMCGHPSVRKYDPEHLTVVQYCSSRCPCNVPSSEEIGQIPYRQPDPNEWACCS